MMAKGRRPVLAVFFWGTAAAALLVVAILWHHHERKPDDPEKLVYFHLRNEGMVNRPDWPVTIHVKGVRGRTLLNPVLKWRNAGGDIDTVMIAREGELRVDNESRELLVLLRIGSASSADGTKASFEEREVRVALPPGFGEKQ
jgi:hypothetical protein